MAENKYEKMMLGRAEKALTDIPQAERKTADIRRQQQLQTEDYIRQQEARTAEYGAGLERISRQQQEGVKRAGEEYQRGMMKVDYSPTREEIPQLVQLFSTLTAAAFLAGGKGRQSGMGALSAMTGAMEGYRKGQKEVFDREIKEFDKRLREVQLHNEGVKRQYDIAMQTLKTNREAGLAELKKLEMMATNSKMAYDARRGDLNALAQDVKTQVDAGNKAITDWTTYTRQKAAEARAQAQAELSRRAAERADIALGLKLRGFEEKERQAAPKQIQDMKDGKAKNEAIARASTVGAFDFIIDAVRADNSLVGVLGTARQAGSMASQIPGLGGLADPKRGYIRSLIEAAKTSDYRAFVGSGAMSEGDQKRLNNIFATMPLYSATDVISAFSAARNILANNLEGAGFDTDRESERYYRNYERTFQSGGRQPRAQAAPQQQVNRMPSEEKLRAYANANFNGNVEQARQFLISQGYQ